MYDELVKRLRSVKDSWQTEEESWMLQAADAIEELSKQHETQRNNLIALLNDRPRWIPVEITPEPYEEVLVYLWKDKPYLASIESTGEWSTSDFIIDVDDMPTHWMRLPEPPKGET